MLGISFTLLPFNECKTFFFLLIFFDHFLFYFYPQPFTLPSQNIVPRFKSNFSLIFLKVDEGFSIVMVALLLRMS